MTNIDAAIGHQLRALRLARSMSLRQVGDHLGVSCQQVQKYEVGLNRLGAARLYDLAVLFDVPVSTFFENLTQPDDDSDRAEGSKTAVLAYELRHLTDPQRRAVLALVQSLANDPDPTDRQHET